MFVPVFETHQAMEAQLVRGLLMSNGIAAEVFNQDTASLIGAGQAAVPVTVRVAPDDVSASKAILHEVLPSGEAGRLTLLETLADAGHLSDVAEPSACPNCSEEWEPGFQVCWNCEHELGAEATS